MLRPLLCAVLAAAAFVGLSSAQPAWTVVRSEFIEPAPAVPEVHASTLTELANGSLLAAWFGGSIEGQNDVAIWCSRLDGQHWSPARVVATGVQPNGTQLPTWNPVLYTTADGRVLLFFKVGPSPNTWWGEVMQSTDGGRTWHGRHRLPGTILGPIKDKPVKLANGALLCPSSIEHDAHHWAVRMELTDEALRQWTSSGDVADPQHFGAIQPTVLQHPDGRLQALCRSSARQLVQTWSSDGGHTWSPLESTGLFMANSGIDAVTLRHGGFLLVYNPSSRNADRKTWGERRPLVVSASDDGTTWHPILTLETKRNRQGYAYPAIIQTRDGRVHITYTWNRARIKHVVLERR